MSNESALEWKYGAAGKARIAGAVNELIVADASRGIDTVYLPLDTCAIEPFGATRVTHPMDEAQNKNAVDAIYDALHPRFIMLLGSRDVIPHQHLPNPNYTGVRHHDPDRDIPSDLPYACAATFGSALSAFTSPSRAVGRLPDITGGSNPDYLSYLLRVAATAVQRERQAYQRYFALCAQLWQESTAAVLTDLFNNSNALVTTPTRRPPWSRHELSPVMHFINCHGESGDPSFYGKPGPLPEAFNGADIDGKLVNGTVACVQCCYGAELYSPDERRTTIPMPNSYLRSQAYGYFGSTNTSYGGECDIRDADVLCRSFVARMLDGDSLGEAVLRARVEFARQGDPLHPIRFKTLAQFTLLGDPSLTPVAAPL